MKKIAIGISSLAITAGLIGLAGPAEASHVCNDGTLSESIHRNGTCSGHHGVKYWDLVLLGEAPAVVTPTVAPVPAQPVLQTWNFTATPRPMPADWECIIPQTTATVVSELIPATPSLSETCSTDLVIPKKVKGKRINRAIANHKLLTDKIAGNPNAIVTANRTSNGSMLVSFVYTIPMQVTAS